MREINSTPFVNYKFVNKYSNLDFLKSGTACFSSIFHIKESDFFNDSVITLTNFTTKESQKYIKKYFEILSNIFKVKINYLNDETIEVSDFKSVFYIKLFLTLYRLLFEPAGNYNGYSVDEFKKHVAFFEEVCNSDFKNLDELEQICTSYNNCEIYKGGHCMKKDANSLLKIISIKQLEEFVPEDRQSVNSFFNTY